MFGSKTIFIVGAGASHEVGLPLAPGLTKRIEAALNFRIDDLRGVVGGAQTVRQAIQIHCQTDQQKIAKYTLAAQEVSQGLSVAPSIDYYLQSHQSNAYAVLAGKLAIAYSILEAERKSTLYVSPLDGDANNAPVSGAWMTLLAQCMFEKIVREKVDTVLDNVSFITFNYDRCLELYIRNAIKRFYRPSDSALEATLKKLRVHHVYGRAGKLGWQGGTEAAVSFGEEVNAHQLVSVAQGIRTYSEGMEDGSRDEMLSQLAEAETVVFLGFGFQIQNIEILKLPPSPPAKTRRIYGTASGLSESDQRLITSDLYNVFYSLNDAVELRDIKCTKFFEEYSRSLKQEAISR